MDNQELFVDGIGGIGYENGVIRIDLVSLSPHRRDDEGKALMEFGQRLVLPPEGFLNAFSAMERLINQLVEAGVVTRQSDDPAADPRLKPGNRVQAGTPKPGQRVQTGTPKPGQRVQAKPTKTLRSPNFD